jgi:hypothetical protein
VQKNPKGQLLFWDRNKQLIYAVKGAWWVHEIAINNWCIQSRVCYGYMYLHTFSRINLTVLLICYRRTIREKHIDRWNSDATTCKWTDKVAINLSQKAEKKLTLKNTYSRMFILAPIAPMFTLLISSFPHFLLTLQLLHKMIYVPRLPFLFFLRLLLLLQGVMQKIKN